MADRIITHEDTQQVSLIEFIGAYFKGNGLGTLPPPVRVKGKVFAEINHGRWVVECPNQDGGAIVVSAKHDIFLCTECGSPENGGHWYRVVFPPERAAIEAALLKRPALNPWHAPQRNWKRGESVADLERQNRERKIT